MQIQPPRKRKRRKSMGGNLKETSCKEVVTGEWRKRGQRQRQLASKERQEGLGPRSRGTGRFQSDWVGGRVSCYRDGLRPEIRFQL